MKITYRLRFAFFPLFPTSSYSTLRRRFWQLSICIMLYVWSFPHSVVFSNICMPVSTDFHCSFPAAEAKRRHISSILRFTAQLAGGCLVLSPSSLPHCTMSTAQLEPQQYRLSSTQRLLFWNHCCNLHFSGISHVRVRSVDFKTAEANETYIMLQ
jgi:hypothetical protein